MRLCQDIPALFRDRTIDAVSPDPRGGGVAAARFTTNDARRLAASGLFARTGLRQEIPPELWADGKIEFAAGRLTLGEFAYAAVTVGEAAIPGFKPGTAPPAVQDDPAAAIRAFIEERRRRQGDEIKKALREAAREKFGEAFAVRRFDAAYAAVYGRRRGRPEKSTSK